MLERLYTHDEETSVLTPEIIRVFRRRVRHIEAAENFEDLRDPRGVPCDAMEGTEKFLLRLMDGYGLVLSEDVRAKRIVIHQISPRRNVA